MKGATPQTGFNAMLRQMDQVLSPIGFQKRGAVFRLLKEGNCGIVEFQKSVESTGDVTRFTVNIGIICGRLFNHWFLPLTKAGAMDAHLEMRIGRFLPGKPDRWWSVRSDEEPSAVASEISRTLIEVCIPYILKYMDTSELVNLWKSGENDGLTDRQRERLLARVAELGL